MASQQSGGKEALTIQLRDGRRLGYAEYGDLNGEPVFHFHGWPGSRLEGRLVTVIDPIPGIRIIATDRPGMGLSDYQPHRRIVDWADDIAELADALKLHKFVVEGVSGGGPYSLACAYRLPDRVRAAVVVAGVGPMGRSEDTKNMRRSNRIVFALARISPLLMQIGCWKMARTLSGDRAKAMAAFAADLGPADRAALGDGRGEIMLDELKEAYRMGTKGAAYDGHLFVKPWGFPLEGIKVPVHFWQGDQDVNVAPEMARKMVDSVPGARLTVLPGEGHFSLPFRHFGTILRAIGSNA